MCLTVPYWIYNTSLPTIYLYTSSAHDQHASCITMPGMHNVHNTGYYRVHWFATPWKQKHCSHEHTCVHKQVMRTAHICIYWLLVLGTACSCLKVPPCVLMLCFETSFPCMCKQDSSSAWLSNWLYMSACCSRYEYICSTLKLFLGFFLSKSLSLTSLSQFVHTTSMCCVHNHLKHTETAYDYVAITCYDRWMHFQIVMVWLHEQRGTSAARNYVLSRCTWTMRQYSG